MTVQRFRHLAQIMFAVLITLAMQSGQSVAARSPLDNDVLHVSPPYYLFPYNLHLVSGTTSPVPLAVVDNAGNTVPGDITFHGYDTSLISISPGGYVTGLRTEGDTEIGTWVHATIDGVAASNTAVVRVLPSAYGIPFSQIAGQNTILYYPTNVNGEDLSAYVARYEIPTVNEYVYSIQQELIGTRPFDGAKQIFEVDFGATETQRVCGISGNPIRLGWNINGNNWENCFLVPFIPPRSPQSNVMYHEMGHNFTWASRSFAEGLGRFEYSEGLATAISAAAIQTILNQPTDYPIETDATAALRQQLTALNNTMGSAFQDWLGDGASFSELSPDIIDGIWLYYNAKRPNEFAKRFFLPLQPQYAAQLSGVMSNVLVADQHTVFAGLVSSAMGQDLSATFSSSYHYPVNVQLFASIYQAFTQITEDSFPYSWMCVSRRPADANRGMAAVYDANRHRMVVFGGKGGSLLAETWEFDGATWRQISTTHRPAPRMWHGMAYDSSRRVTVLFGGQKDGPRLNDTWEYDGVDWRQVILTRSPSARDGFGMTYDNCRGRVVLWGGSTDSGLSTESWEYNGSEWNQIVTSTQPPGRSLSAMTFDSSKCRTVLFGGGTTEWNGLNDTWEYDGSTWRQQTLTQLPDPRWGHALVFDAALGKAVLFGGFGADSPGGQQLGDMWLYDGTWTQVFPDQAPEAREQHAMTYDEDHNRLVLFGGWNLGYLLNGDTWIMQQNGNVFLPFLSRGY